MKTKTLLILITVLFSILGLQAQSVDADAGKTQIIEFSNVNLGNNHYSGEVYCFDNTKVTFVLRTSSMLGKFQGTILFMIGTKTFTVESNNDDYTTETTQVLPKGKTNVSISLFPAVENIHKGDASIEIVATNKGSVGRANIISSIK